MSIKNYENQSELMKIRYYSLVDTMSLWWKWFMEYWV